MPHDPIVHHRVRQIRTWSGLLGAFNGMRFAPCIKGNLLRGISGAGHVALGGALFGADTAATALQIGAGGTGTLTRNLSIHGDAAWQTKLGDRGG